MFGVEDAWLAWSFDQQVWNFGAKIDGKLNERNKDGKPRHTLQGLLASEQIKINPDVRIPGATEINPVR